MKNSLTAEERFWSKIVKGEKENDCWNWISAVSKTGYPVIRVDGRTAKASRFCWEIHHGKIPEGMMICHRCDTPMCCNPSHLFLGTAGENARDMVRKERHGRMKFTHDQVRRIRALYERHRNHLTHKRIAEWFGVSKATISHMMTGRNWKLTEGAHEKGIRRRRYNSKMDSEKVLEMRQRRNNGESLKSLSEHFGINQSGVSKICLGKKWSHV